MLILLRTSEIGCSNLHAPRGSALPSKIRQKPRLKAGIYARSENKGLTMPEQETLRNAAKAKHEGKSPSTQAGEFVREEIHHIREGKHGARSTKQAIAIGLSKARRAGVNLKPPKKGWVSRRTSQAAKQDYAAGRRPNKKASASRSLASLDALRREGKSSASSSALSRQARKSARSRAGR